MSPAPTQHSPFALWSVRGAALWLALGALAKLFIGTPFFMPQWVRENTPFELNLTYMLVIGIELSIVAIAFLRPRWAWWMLVALFAFFEFLLATQLAAGAESCGCFGGQISFPPWLMMGIDSVLLIALLLSRPWSQLASTGPSLPMVAVSVLVAMSAPALYLRSQLQAPPPQPVGTPDSSQAPAELPRWVVLEPEKWVGKSIFDIPELTTWLTADALPTDGLLIFYRQGCSHCAEHLSALASRDQAQQPITLVQIRDDLKDGRAVELMPTGEHVKHLAYPDALQVMLQTPWELELVGGEIKAALDEAAAREKLGLPSKD